MNSTNYIHNSDITISSKPILKSKNQSSNLLVKEVLDNSHYLHDATQKSLVSLNSPSERCLINIAAVSHKPILKSGNKSSDQEIKDYIQSEVSDDSPDATQGSFISSVFSKSPYESLLNSNHIINAVNEAEKLESTTNILSYSIIPDVNNLTSCPEIQISSANSNSPGLYLCFFCNIFFYEKNNFLFHFKDFHQKASISVENDNVFNLSKEDSLKLSLIKYPPEEAKCSTKEIGTPNSFVNEESSVELEVYKCDDCNEEFSSFKFLKLHLFEEEHTFHCSDCENFKTIGLEDLFNHSKDIHATAISGKLAQHLNKCPYCPFLNDSKLKLSKHIAKTHSSTHISIEERPEVLFKRVNQETIDTASSLGLPAAKELNYEETSSIDERSVAISLIRIKHANVIDVTKEPTALPLEKVKQNTINVNMEQESSKQSANTVYEISEIPFENINIKSLYPICYICKKRFTLIMSLKQHLHIIHNHNFESKEEFIRFVHSKQSKLNQIYSYRCDICNEGLESKSVILRNSHFLCSPCDYQASSQVDFDSHSKKVYSCPDSLSGETKNHKTPEDFAVNLLNENPKKSSISPKYICFKCRNTFKSFKELKGHLSKLNHGQQCVICNYYTVSTINFHCHNANEHKIELHKKWEQSVLKCSWCSYFVENCHALKDHVYKTHVYKPTEILNKHADIQNNTKPNTNNTAKNNSSKNKLIDGKIISFVSSLSTEMENHKNNKEIPNFLVNLHIENHKKSNIPLKHVCFKCRKSFKSYEGLRKHLIKLKHGRQCAICNYRTTSSLKFHCHNANEHQIKLHKKLKESVLKCSRCCYFLENSNELKDHVSKAHCVSRPVEILNKNADIQNNIKPNTNNPAKNNSSENELIDDKVMSFVSPLSNEVENQKNKECNKQIPKYLVNFHIESPKKSNIPSKHICFKCKKSFKTYEGLKKHLIKLKHGRQCAKCNYRTTSTLNFHCHNANEHQSKLDKKVKESVLKCSRCSYFVENSNVLKDHVYKAHSISRCFEILNENADIQNNLQSNRDNTLNNSSKNELTPLLSEMENCKMNVHNTPEDFAVNLLKKNPKKSNGSPIHICFICKKTFKTFKELNKHLAKLKHGRQCAICYYRTASTINFHCHNSNEHQIELQKKWVPSVLKCLQCSYVYLSSTALKDHVSKAHSVSRLVEIRNEIADSQNNIKPNRNSTVKNNNSENELINNKIISLVSPLSTRMENRKNNEHNKQIPDYPVDLHIENHKSNISPKHICFKCRKSFKSFEELRKHLIKLKHGRQCEKCNYRTTSVLNFHCHNANEHQSKLHKKLKKTVLKCPRCSYFVENSNALKHHVYKAHSISRFVVILNKNADIQNNLQSNRKNTLNNSSKIESTHLLSEMKNHKKNVHKNTPEDFAVNFLNKNPKKSNGSPIHICFKCKKTFKIFKELNKHLAKLKHGRQCAICYYRTASTINFHCHNANEHQIELRKKWVPSVLKCLQCSYVFESSTALKDHVSKAHSVSRLVEIRNEIA